MRQEQDYKPWDRKFALPPSGMLWNPVISSCVLHSNMLSDIRYSDISLKAVLVTAFTTSGYSSEWFVMKHLWLGGRRREDYLFSDTRQDYRYSTHFPSQMFESSPAQIPMFSKKTFCLFLPQAITLKLICGSGFFWRVQQTLRYRTGVDFVGVDLLILPTGSMDIQLYKISNQGF